MRVQLAVLTTVLVCSVASSLADDGWERASLTLTEENDTALSDRNYTQGAKIQFLSPDHADRGCFTSIMPSLGYDAPRWKWGVDLGHEIYTPEDLSQHKLIRHDRPYAGWLYGGLIFQQRGTNASGTPVMETFRLRGGVVGPNSQADHAQVSWHRTFGFDNPNGWRNQIKNEVGGQLLYDRRYRYALGDVWSVQFIPEGGVQLGNIRIDGHLSGLLRAGYNIPNEFGLGGSTHDADFGCHLFAGVTGYAVALDVFLDGNNFRHSHAVDRKELVGEARVGIAFTTRHVEFSATHVRRTHEFEAQDESTGYTSLALTAKF
jgi:lipid A 3-O-deacylase